MNPQLIIFQLADRLRGYDSICQSTQAGSHCDFRACVQPKDRRVRRAMLFSVSDRQLRLTNSTHASQNEYFSDRTHRRRLGLQNLLHFLDFGLTTDEKTSAHVRGIEEVQTEVVFYRCLSAFIHV